MPVTPVGTVNVSALLSLPIPKPVMKLEPALNGELQPCVVCTVQLHSLSIKSTRTDTDLFETLKG